MKVIGCGECGRLDVDPYTPGCDECRERETLVGPLIARLKAMAPCCREAYVRGRLSAAFDGNDHHVIRELGRMLDEMRTDADRFTDQGLAALSRLANQS